MSLIKVEPNQSLIYWKTSAVQEWGQVGCDSESSETNAVSYRLGYVKLYFDCSYKNVRIY